MIDEKEIEIVLLERGVPMAGPIVPSRDADKVYYAFVRTAFDKIGKRTPTSFALNMISRELLAMGHTVEFVVVNGERADLEGSLKTMLFGKYPNKIRNIFSSFPNNKADIWIEPKAALDESDAYLSPRLRLEQQNGMTIRELRRSEA